MSALEVVAKPEFGKVELEWLKKLRETKAHNAGAPYFTLVFPGADYLPDVVRHIEAVCAFTPRIRFCLRSAVMVPEHKTGWFHVFLVPDEGFSTINRFHDRLHVGPLAGCLRLAVPSIPHLTVASTADPDDARHLMSALNSKDLAINGRIDEVEVQTRDGGETRCIARVPLVRGGLFH
jgi:hypothetical protein